MNHATIRLGDYVIPLIGIDQYATIERCDLCGKDFSIQDVMLNEAGNQWLCHKCGDTNGPIQRREKQGL